jgi:hypothetical protein
LRRPRRRSISRRLPMGCCTARLLPSVRVLSASSDGGSSAQ